MDTAESIVPSKRPVEIELEADRPPEHKRSRGDSEAHTPQSDSAHMQHEPISGIPRDSAEPSTSANAAPQPEPASDATPALPQSSPNTPKAKGGKKNKNGKRTDSRNQERDREGKKEKSTDKNPVNKGWRRGTRKEGEARPEGEEKAPRLPKRQCAMLIGFCGTGCNGMQIQKDVRTIEGVLFDALVRAGAVSKDNADDPVKVNLGRAARTDAGVHAAGNVVSIKIITQIPGIQDVVARVNEFLPPEIRVWGYVRVQNSFNARLSCDSRKYTYFFPSYLLIPPKPGSGLHKSLSASSTSTPSSLASDFWSSNDKPAGSISEEKEQDLKRKRAWRVGPDMMEKLRETAQKFEATHNFHNFTVGRDFSDRSAQRHMKKIEISDPAVYGETEWISVMFHGQSFMLHQIVGLNNIISVQRRKMMAALVLSVRTGTPSHVIDELYGPRDVFVPKMPSLGLLLEQPIFDSYNRKVSSISANLQPSDPEYRPPIDFDVHREDIEQFKQRHIYDRMRDIEDRGGVFDAWIRSIDSYGGGDLGYLNPKGNIPASAVIKKGERRANPFREKKKFDTTEYAEKGKIEMDEGPEEEAEEETFDKKVLVDMEG